MDATRYVLIICYDYPLISAAGVIRTYRFAKWLPEFGWQPVILTAQSRTTGRVDDIEASDGALTCPKFSANANGLDRIFAAVLLERPHRPAALRGKPSMKRLRELTAQLAVPDGKIGWVLAAVKAGLRIGREYRLSACFSISPRPTAHLVASRLARHLQIPWVADFALPWSDAYWRAGRPRFVQWLDAKIEGQVVKSAQRVTVAYPEIARHLGDRYGGAVADKVAVIADSFDDDLFAQLTPRMPPKFTAIYPGNHFCEPGRHGEAFLDAVDDWISRDPSLEENVEFVFAGKPDEALLQHRKTLSHPGVVRVEPLLSHRACAQAILSSHLCIVNAVGDRIPAKVYECMGAGKPILALTEAGSDLAALLQDYSRGVVIAPRDTAAVVDGLTSAYRGYLNRLETHAAARCVTRHSSRRAAETLSQVLAAL